MIAGVYWDIENMFFRYQQLVRKHILNKGYALGPKIISTSEKNNYRFEGIRRKRGFKHVSGSDNKNGADVSLLHQIHNDMSDVDAIVIVSNDKVFHKIKTDKPVIIFHDNKELTTTEDIELIYIYNNFKKT